MVDPQTKAEDIRPDYVEHNNAKYTYEDYIGKGAFGFVYLYKHPTNKDLKLAIKVENIRTNRTHGSVITKESYYLRMMNEKGCDRVIGYYGDGFCQTAQYMKLEYIDMSLE
jgi:predicted Ser/Thr protein kinase